MDQLATEVFETTSTSNDKQRADLIEWLNSTLPNISLPVNASDEELRVVLVDGSVLCRLLNKLRPGSVVESSGSGRSSDIGSENVKRFLAAMDKMGLPRFQMEDIEKGSMKIVIECLLTLKARLIANGGGCELSAFSSASAFSLKRNGASDSNFHRALRSPVKSESSAALLHHVGHKFQEVFQMKHGCYADLPSTKISEMMKSNRLGNAPTQSLLSVVNGILDEGVEGKNNEIPSRVACLLRKVVQEIERRISTQAEHIKTQNQLFKLREEKYQSRIRLLEALAAGTGEEKQGKKAVPGAKKAEKQDVSRLIDQKDNSHDEIASLKQELETTKKNYEELRLQMGTADKRSQEIKSLKQELQIAKQNYDQLRLQMDREANGSRDATSLQQELETTRKDYEARCLQMETEAKGIQQDLEGRLKEVVQQLTDSKYRVKELQSSTESKSQRWKKKEHIYQICTEFQLGVLKELKHSSQSIRKEMTKTQKSYLNDISRLGNKIKELEKAAENYHAVLTENRKMHNELQDLKGNIRVYCRIRPFLPGQTAKQSIVEYVGDNGELIVVNPSKQGKESRRSFKFNQVYSPRATQVDVYTEIQPLIQSVLDGYNVCIFAYGQTGSGKTYTMSGPDNASEEDWGVNYRALNDLFNISQRRQSTLTYEIGVQMVEIYNEQVRDLLSSGGSQKRLGILSTSQPSGLAVPDASMHPVQSTSDVMDLMEIGLKNRAKGSTAMNQRSSRSHSVLTIHASGTDLKTGSLLRGNLHLVDLAGSERIDRSEVTGDRLKEAQHINKSLSALGDVIFALAQKSNHIPYRNSKLTQVLQSSLGGQAKTIMFVQLNPEVISYTESLSTLKFAERVSGVELGAARSSKEGKDVKELMELIVSLKDTIAKKDEEIERLQLLKNVEKRAVATRPSQLEEENIFPRDRIKIEDLYELIQKGLCQQFKIFDSAEMPTGTGAVQSLASDFSHQQISK